MESAVEDSSPSGSAVESGSECAGAPVKRARRALAPTVSRKHIPCLLVCHGVALAFALVLRNLEKQDDTPDLLLSYHVDSCFDVGSLAGVSSVKDLLLKLHPGSELHKLIRQCSNITLYEIGRSKVQSILAFGSGLLCQMPYSAGLVPAEAGDLPLPSRCELRDALGPGRPGRPRLQCSSKQQAQVQRHVLQAAVGHRLRSSHDLRPSLASMLKLLANTVSADVEADAHEMGCGAKKLLKDRIRCDAVACLMSRALYQEAPKTLFLLADASPQCFEEVFGVHLESLKGVDLSTLQSEKLPGSTLQHGHFGLGQKVFNLLWSLWLNFGGSRANLQIALANVRCVVTDLGVEKRLCDTRDCLSAFLSHCASFEDDTHTDDQESAASSEQYLFPRALWIPGWNHLWSGIMETVLNSLESFEKQLPKMRVLVKFLRVKGHRHKFASWLDSQGLGDAATQVRAPFHASFLHWRWNTMADVFEELVRLSSILQRWLPLCKFGSL